MAGQLLWLVSYYSWSATTAGQLLQLVSHYGWSATTAGQLLRLASYYGWSATHKTRVAAAFCKALHKATISCPLALATVGL